MHMLRPMTRGGRPAIAAGLASELAGLAWLIGDWEAVPDASGSTGGSSFAATAGGRAVVRTNWAAYPATAERPAQRHDDVLLVYPDGAGLAALYVDNEGHVIRYDVQASDRDVVLASIEGGPGPRFRLTYAAEAAGTASVTFEIAPPGQDFAPYVGGTLRRVAAEAT